VSDVPLGAFLSGGMDSTLIVGMMARLLDRPVETFTIGFEDSRYDETASSRLASRKFQTHAHEEVIGSESLDVLESLLDRLGQPFADPSAIPTLLVSRLARRHVTVSLSGDGGDELFGGYTRYGVASAQQWYDHVPKMLRTAVASAWPPRVRGAGLLEIAAQDFRDRYFSNMSLFTPRERQRIFGGILRQRESIRPLDDAEDLVRSTQDQLRHVDDLLRLDLHSYLPDVILTKVDRMSMDCSLEARVPLLDHELVEFVFSLPPQWRIGKVGTKSLLRDTFGDLYPEELLKKRKTGFGVPLGSWLAGPLRERLKALPSSASVREGVFRKEAVQDLVREHLSGRRDRGRKLWALLVFDKWWSSRRRPAPQSVPQQTRP
ncbi:MAG: asparagine synthetase B family protein, partial [Acidobacteriota bacterium]